MSGIGASTFFYPSASTFPGSSSFSGYSAVSPAIYPGTIKSDTTTLPGQGDRVVHLVMVAFDDASDSIPTWVDVSSRVREFSISRGRASELEDVDAGTETLTLDNRDRAFDPTNASSPYYPNVRAMNRLWHRVQFNGQTYDVFKGWVESYEQQWPNLVDAVTVVHAADEFKVLALRNLPTTDPPRDTYADVIAFDNPAGHWRMNDDASSFAERAETGPDLGLDTSVANGMTSLFAPGIVGENPDPYGSLQLAATDYLFTEAVDARQGVDGAGLSAITVETWFQTTGFPGGAHTIIRGPQSVYGLQLDPAGTITMFVTNDSAVTFNATSSTIAANTWYHVAGVVNGSNTLIYLNGVQVGSASFSGSISASTAPAYPYLRIGSPSSASTMTFDEVAIYRYALPAARLTAHYNAGANCGFALGQQPGQRIGAILDSIRSQAPRDIDVGNRSLTGQYAGNGQHSLDMLRDVENAEAVDAFMFIAGDGAITFRDGHHRFTGPYITPKITFGDQGGSQRPYQDLVLDFSDAFIANTWNVTRDGGTVQTTSDTTSIASYLERPQSLTDLKLRNDTDAADIASKLLSKYAQPILRATSIQPQTPDQDVAEQIFGIELGDRIRVIRNPPGGGAAFDQQLFVQRIDISGDPSMDYPQVVLGVSPV